MNKEYIELIHDENEVKWFFDKVLPPLAPAEIYFFSLSARNKYLTMEEREMYGLGRTEMFEKTIVRERNWEKFIKKIRRLECDTRGYVTRKNLPIPSKTMVLYVNINPSNTLKAIGKLNILINEYFQEMGSLALKGGDTENFINRINKIDNNLMSYYQQATGTVHWVDFDFDVPKNEDFIYYATEMLKDFRITNYYWIDTKSGYHCLVDNKQIRFNPNDLTKSLEKMFLDKDILDNGEKYEIIYNKNAMVPLPGTYQGGHPVRIINK
jgi:hypothetical protein